jgi:hypothetical protein
MIEIKKSGSSEPGTQYQLFVNNVLVEGYVFGLRGKNSTDLSVFASVHKRNDSERLAAHLFTELPAELEEVKLGLDLNWPETVYNVEVRRQRDDKGSFRIGFKFEFDYEDWKGPHSFAEYADAFRQAVEGMNRSDVVWEPDDKESLANGFWISFAEVSTDSSIIGEVSRCSSTLSEVTNLALMTLETSVIDESLVVSFDFPEDIKVPCEQYLLYFVQFLKDLGVEATSDLRHQAGRVLFSVTPTDEKEALYKIRAALEAYLHLPASPTSGFLGIESDIAIQRLVANIHHLEGQLVLAQAVLQAKDATIGAQQLTMDHQQRILNGEVVFESLRTVTPNTTSKDKEELLSGTLAITRYEGKGFEINLPELFRKLRNLFAHDK